MAPPERTLLSRPFLQGALVMPVPDGLTIATTCTLVWSSQRSYLGLVDGN